MGFISGVKKDRLSNIAKYWIENGTPRPETRGGARKEEENAVKREAVREHITKFTCRASHYARRDAPGRKYLSSELNVAKMYQMFKEQDHRDISYSLYYSIFSSDFNLGFGRPSKDVCGTCLKFRIELKDPEISDQDKRRKTVMQMLHRRRGRQFYDTLNAVNDSFTVCFDIMENLVLPKSSIGQAYYSRQLYLYVFGVVRHRGALTNQTKDDIHLFVWSECDNKKDSNMVASALHYYFSTVARNELSEYTKLRLFSDSCYGQNKNINVLSMLFSLRKNVFSNLNIEYTFPVRGHSFLPADRVFGRLEKDIKRQETILLPSEYINIFRRHANVHIYGDSWECLDFKAEAAKHCCSSRSFKISKAKVLEINGDQLGMKEGYNGEFSHFNVLKRGKNWNTFNPKQVENINFVNEAKKLDVFGLLRALGVSNDILSFYKDTLGDDCAQHVGPQDLEDSDNEE